jgi:hypothetical protein
MQQDHYLTIMQISQRHSTAVLQPLQPPAQLCVTAQHCRADRHVLLSEQSLHACLACFKATCTSRKTQSPTPLLNLSNKLRLRVLA